VRIAGHSYVASFVEFTTQIADEAAGAGDEHRATGNRLCNSTADMQTQLDTSFPKTDTPDERDELSTIEWSRSQAGSRDPSPVHDDRALAPNEPEVGVNSSFLRTLVTRPN
jgi:hypothetical protein